MKAIDTCVLARFFVADDPVQTPLAERQIHEGGFIPITVMLELAWLLASRYRYSLALVADSLEELLKLPNIIVAHQESLPWVIARYRAGADVADVIHIVAAEGCSAFATFDDMGPHVGGNAPMAVQLLGT